MFGSVEAYLQDPGTAPCLDQKQIHHALLWRFCYLHSLHYSELSCFVLHLDLRNLLGSHAICSILLRCVLSSCNEFRKFPPLMVFHAPQSYELTLPLPLFTLKPLPDDPSLFQDPDTTMALYSVSSP
ncbi:unnamed protein product [Lupinus luteus]|uniref:Uncharacterized protein n=1 Tax=Lupinus luteus TaxID=3873 RepID=A0AAV1W713_LUPLU